MSILDGIRDKIIYLLEDEGDIQDIGGFVEDILKDVEIYGETEFEYGWRQGYEAGREDGYDATYE